VRPFAGDWPRLKGKSVLFVFALPRAVLSDVAADRRKVLFLKRDFAYSYQSAMHSSTSFQGVVVIFAGSGGAIAAATRSILATASDARATNTPVRRATKRRFQSQRWGTVGPLLSCKPSLRTKVGPHYAGQVDGGGPLALPF
jgi:hypothetical protein